MRVGLLSSLVVVGLAGSSVPIACECGYSETPFRCSPSGSSPSCPDGYQCCSDDPAAVGGGLPGYSGRDDGDLPLFSGLNNSLSATGMCVEEGALPAGVGLIEPAAAGCPVPCNPRWNEDEVEAVCGPSTICCQTVELGPKDCVLEDGCWRPATGLDIFSDAVEGTWGEGPDPWTAAVHDTHQDPGGRSCRAFAQGDPAAEQDCLRQLGVADQRGFCLGRSPDVQACPLEDPGYLDACEQRNRQESRECG